MLYVGEKTLLSAGIAAAVLGLVALLAGPAMAESATDPGTDEACTLHLGVVPQFEQRRLTAVWQPIAAALSARIDCDVTLHGSNSIPEFEAEFSEGKFDFAYMNPYHAVMAHNAQGYVPVIRSDESRLKGILVVRADDPIQSIEELHGKELAFPSPNALGASLLMRTELAVKHGIKVTPKYVKTHSSTYIHVLKDLAAAGGGVARTLREQPEPIKDALRVLYTTQEVFAHPIVVHPRVDPARRDAIQAALLEIAAETPELFAGIPMKSPTEADYGDYEGLSEMGLERFAE